jgi:hypothetical protein
MLRLLRLVCGPALPACFAIIGICLAGITSASAQSEEARQACSGDATSLCGEFVPDVAKVTACMMRKRAQLSAGCRMAMAHQHAGYQRAGRMAARPYVRPYAGRVQVHPYAYAGRMPARAYVRAPARTYCTHYRCR